MGCLRVNNSIRASISAYMALSNLGYINANIVYVIFYNVTDMLLLRDTPRSTERPDT